MARWGGENAQQRGLLTIMTNKDDSAALAAAGPDADETRAEFTALFDEQRARLQRLIRRRIDPRLQGRFDDSDVLQETYIEAAARFTAYRARPDMPADRWLQFLAHQKLMELARRHLAVAGRSVRREAARLTAGSSAAEPAELAEALLGALTSPSGAAIRDEARDLVRSALETLDPSDRDVLALRHFEQLSHSEAARVLGLTPAASSKRYVRALRRLREALEPAPGDGGGSSS